MIGKFEYEDYGDSESEKEVVPENKQKIFVEIVSKKRIEREFKHNQTMNLDQSVNNVLEEPQKMQSISKNDIRSVNEKDISSNLGKELINNLTQSTNRRKRCLSGCQEQFFKIVGSTRLFSKPKTPDLNKHHHHYSGMLSRSALKGIRQQNEKSKYLLNPNATKIKSNAIAKGRRYFCYSSCRKNTSPAIKFFIKGCTKPLQSPVRQSKLFETALNFNTSFHRLRAYTQKSSHPTSVNQPSTPARRSVYIRGKTLINDSLLVRRSRLFNDGNSQMDCFAAYK